MWQRLMASKSCSRLSMPSGVSGMAARLARMWSETKRVSCRFAKQPRLRLFLMPRMVFSSLKAYLETTGLLTEMLRKQLAAK